MAGTSNPRAELGHVRLFVHLWPVLDPNPPVVLLALQRFTTAELGRTGPMTLPPLHARENLTEELHEFGRNMAALASVVLPEEFLNPTR